LDADQWSVDADQLRVDANPSVEERTKLVSGLSLWLVQDW
jgi:hypothetical protein